MSRCGDIRPFSHIKCYDVCCRALHGIIHHEINDDQMYMSGYDTFVCNDI